MCSLVTLCELRQTLKAGEITPFIYLVIHSFWLTGYLTGYLPVSKWTVSIHWVCIESWVEKQKHFFSRQINKISGNKLLSFPSHAAVISVQAGISAETHSECGFKSAVCHHAY